MKANAALIQDTRRAKASGKYPIKLRITFNRRQMYYPLNIDLSEVEFDQIQKPKACKRLRELQIKIMAKFSKANSIIDNVPDFSFPLFERKFTERSRNAENIYLFFEEKINKLREGSQYGTATNYQCTMNSLRRFKPVLGFKEIDTDFLRQYENWMLGAGKSVTTVSIYVRTLRAIFNDAIAEGIISREFYYPFGKRLYQIPTSRNIKKALSMSEIQKIFELSIFTSNVEKMAVDFWKFSYLCNGMNMKDVAFLKYKNIDGEFIKFRREKTKETSRGDARTISVVISDPVREIIRKWGNKKKNPENYIFNIISAEISEEKKRLQIQLFIHQVNKYMKRVANSLGIDKPITTYYARHSFATILKHSGASVEFISESLGHSSILTTASYLDSFEDGRKMEMAKRLIAF